MPESLLFFPHACTCFIMDAGPIATGHARSSSRGGPAMLTVLGSHQRSGNGFTRRETLKAGALGLLGGFGVPQLLAAAENRGEGRPGRGQSVSLLYLRG